MQLEEFYDYKNLLMKEICGNEEIVKLVTGNNQAAVPNHDLPYSQVFPFEYVPKTVDEGKTFICFDVDIARVDRTTTYRPVIYVWAFTHQSLLRMPNGEGVLIDRLSVLINNILDGSRCYGMGELKMGFCHRFSPITGYLGRVLSYCCMDLNRPAGLKPTPPNRKPNRKNSLIS